MKKESVVEIKETLTKRLIVRGDNPLEIIEDAYNQQKIILTSDNYLDTEFNEISKEELKSNGYMIGNDIYTGTSDGYNDLCTYRNKRTELLECEINTIVKLATNAKLTWLSITFNKDGDCILKDTESGEEDNAICISRICDCIDTNLYDPKYGLTSYEVQVLEFMMRDMGLLDEYKKDIFKKETK